MTAEADDEQPQPRRLRPRVRIAIVVLALLLVAILLAWSQRRGIAEGFIDRELARRGVAARYTIRDIGLSRQRLENVVIGDPADPDLVAGWVDVGTQVGIDGPAVSWIAAGPVRMRARLMPDGTVSLGALDRLMPAPSGKPFALPAIVARARDVRVRLETPYGVVGLRLSGSGKLSDGFVGRLAAVGDGLDLGGCVVERFAAATAVRTSGERPTIEGPVRAAAVACGDMRATGLAADLAVTLGAALDRWTGHARFAVDRAAMAAQSARQIVGTASFDGTAQATAGDLDVKAAALAARDIGVAEAGRIAGRYRAGGVGLEFNGHVTATRARMADAYLRRLRSLKGTGAGTPAGPLVDRIAAAGEAAARNLTLDADVEAVARGTAGALRIGRATLASASGARWTIDGPRLRFGVLEVGGRVAMRGGGLPEGLVDLRQQGRGLTGTATLQPYRAANAELRLAPVRFASAGDATTIATQATLSGPLGDGRIEALALPVDARWAGARLVVNPRCTPLAWRRLSVAGLVLDPARLALCPLDGGLVTIDGGRLGGGARIAAPALKGRLGGTPVDLAAKGAAVRLTDRGFILNDVAARLGATGRVTRIDAKTLSGRIAGGAVQGGFSGGGGQIANVPLVLSDAEGQWRLAGGRLELGGKLVVSDAAAEARFKPLASDDVKLTLAGNRIDATGILRAPKTRGEVAAVSIAHDLGAGAGRAVLDVPGLVFAEKGLQPDDLTPITFGVIAEVKGAVRGRGEIAWSPAGVTSTGRFATDGTDLAAAFGPVTGIRGEIVFTDLLGLVSAPDQVATIATVNPGIAVDSGTLRYHLVGDSRVAVAGGRWPFAGGELVLDPTLLDFNEHQERRLVFQVRGVEAAGFLQQFDFDNVNATGVFDGTLPMVFDESGGRIENGRLRARSGGSLAYVGTLTEEDLGWWGNIAFQALKALDYRNLDITMNGPLAGEMVSEIRFAGVSQGKGTRSNFLIRRLAKLPFVFNITIRAPFRQLLDSVRSYYDPSRLVQRNLPTLLEEQRRREQQQVPRPGDDTSPANRPATIPRPIQPSESEKRP